MEFRLCSTQREYRQYIRFIKELYANDEHYRDYMTPMLKELLVGKGVFSQKTFREAYLINEGGLIGVVMFMISQEYSEVLQIAFLEYKDLEGRVAEAVLKYAQTMAIKKGIYKISVGLNGHVNYSLGFTANYYSRPTFGEVYTKTYYAKDFSNLVREYNALGDKDSVLRGEEIGLSSYAYPWDDLLFPANKRWTKRLQNQFQFRTMTPKSFKADMAIYSELNNACFSEHPFYFKTEAKECRELFQDLRFFMDQESLIFIEYKGKAIGFLLWYPDWGELMNPGETVSWRTYIKCLLYKKQVKTFKLIEWGVLPKFQGRGVPIALLYYCYLIIKDKGYKYCKTSWILDKNNNSNSFAKKWATRDHTYKAYEFNVIKEKKCECISKTSAMDSHCKIS